jgi:hypothetical protein
MAMAGHPPGTKEGLCSGVEEEGERGRPDRKLTGNSPVGSAWPEDGRRRAIWAAELGLLRGKSGQSAAISGTPARFFGRGGRGRRHGPSQHVGGAGGSTGRRRYASAMVAELVTGRRLGERAVERGRERRRRGGTAPWRDWASPEGLLGGLGGKQEVASGCPEASHAGRSSSVCLNEEDNV